MKIFWYTRSPVLFSSLLEDSLSRKANGGNSYDFAAAKALKSRFELVPQEVAVQKEDFISYWLRFRKTRFRSNAIHIMEPLPIALGRVRSRSKKIGIIHHIDINTAANSLKHRLYLYLLLRKLKSLDCVVTVSKVWKEYLLNKGCRNVDVIYNSFNPEDYLFPREELVSFKESLGLDTSKKLIYIGNAGNGKGVSLVYNQLKNHDYELVMTGARNDAKELPVKFFNLDAHQYRQLIASCDLVLAMSNMVEGWNRIAHEALLSKVPVIGSGSGGMQELLDSAGQISCRQGEDLHSKVIKALSQKVKLGEKGYNFVKQFNQEYFINSWIEVVNKLNQ